MRKYRVVFRPRAARDLIDLYRTISGLAGANTAGDYLERVETACLALGIFPERGAKRDDLSPGLRIVGFERRATIAFQVEGARVRIIRVFHGGQNYEHILRDSRN